jgi:hypothetical protein
MFDEVCLIKTFEGSMEIYYHRTIRVGRKEQMEEELKLVA